ncbi:MAG: methyltransferase domain-containing protein [Candidatus Neomarinimicrobiota bacterium]
MKTLFLILIFTFLCSGCASFKKFGYEGFNRDKWQHPDKVIESLKISPGDYVTDLGAGGGYFTFKFADVVGDNGKVFAVDVDEDMTEFLRAEAVKQGFAKVEVILGEFGDPLLPDSVSNIIFMCNTYHHIQGRVDYFSRLKADLQSEGRVAVVELRPGGWIGRLFGSHWTKKEAIISEMEAAGYSLIADHDYLPKQHFVVFSMMREIP